MTIPSLPAIDRTSPTFRSDLDTFFLTQLPATTVAFNAEIGRINGIGYGSYNATSTTSLSIGTGSKSLTVETGRGFAVGQALLIASTASPANYMSGQVTSYDSGTGALVVNATASNGSGTLAAWTISITALAGGSAPTVLQRAITGADTLIAADQGKLINASGTFTLAVTAAASLGNGWYCYLRNTSNGDVTVDPSTSEQIDGANTFVLKPGFTVLLACDGTAFTALKVKERTYTNIASYTASGTFVVPADTYVIRGYAWGKGGDATGSAVSGGGGGCAYGDIAVTPGETVTITIASNIAKVITSATDRLTANPASGVTAGTASKHASVTNGGAYSGGAGRSGAWAGGASSGSPLGAGVAASTSDGGTSWAFASTSGNGAGLGESSGPSGRYGGGSLRNPTNAYTDPLLAGINGTGGAGAPGDSSGLNVGGDGGPGAGGGGCFSANSGAAYGGRGGFGAGGGTANSGTSGAVCGAGGFGGGGGGSGGSGHFGGNGGLGGGGGGSATTPGTGGAACVLIYY